MSPRGVCTHVRRVPPGRELGRPGGGGVGGSGLFCSFWIPVEQLRRRASPPGCPGLPTAPRRAPHAAVRERLHRGRAQAHTWVELCGRPSQTYQDGPGKRFQRAGTHGAWWVWSAHGQGLLRTQTMAPSQLGGDDLPAPGGHPCPLLPLEFLWASKGGVYGDAVRSHNLLVFSELFFPPQDHRKRQVWPLSFSKLSLFTS